MSEAKYMRSTPDGPLKLKFTDKRNGKSFTLVRKPYAEPPVGGYDPEQVATRKFKRRAIG